VIAKAIVNADGTGLTYKFNEWGISYGTWKLFVYGLVSSAMGFSFGLIIGIICYRLHINSRRGYFNDSFNWII
jgi:hypothetical protein